jgi:hypothetical protein
MLNQVFTQKKEWGRFNDSAMIPFVIVPSQPSVQLPCGNFVQQFVVLMQFVKLSTRNMT